MKHKPFVGMTNCARRALAAAAREGRQLSSEEQERIALSLAEGTELTEKTVEQVVSFWKRNAGRKLTEEERLSYGGDSGMVWAQHVQEVSMGEWSVRYRARLVTASTISAEGASGDLADHAWEGYEPRPVSAAGPASGGVEMPASGAATANGGYATGYMPGPLPPAALLLPPEAFE